MSTGFGFVAVTPIWAVQIRHEAFHEVVATTVPSTYVRYRTEKLLTIPYRLKHGSFFRLTGTNAIPPISRQYYE